MSYGQATQSRCLSLTPSDVPRPMATGRVHCGIWPVCFSFFLEYARALHITVDRSFKNIREDILGLTDNSRGYILAKTSLASIGINLNYTLAYGAMAEGRRAAPSVIVLDAVNNSSRASMFAVDREPLK